MKDMDQWLKDIMTTSSKNFFDGKDFGTFGVGGSIPFLGLLGNLYPHSNIIALGLLGPHANAHAPNEKVNLNYAKKLTCAMSHIMVEVGAHK